MKNISLQSRLEIGILEQMSSSLPVLYGTVRCVNRGGPPLPSPPLPCYLERNKERKKEIPYKRGQLRTSLPPVGCNSPTPATVPTTNGTYYLLRSAWKGPPEGVDISMYESKTPNCMFANLSRYYDSSMHLGPLGQYCTSMDQQVGVLPLVRFDSRVEQTVLVGQTGSIFRNQLSIFLVIWPGDGATLYYFEYSYDHFLNTYMNRTSTGTVLYE